MTQTSPPLTLLRSKEQTAALVEQILQLPAGRRIDRLISFPDPRQVVQAIPPRELYATVREAGIMDAAPLLPFLSPEQMTFCLDFEWWREYAFDPAAWREWLPYILEGREEGVRAFLHGVDEEMLLLILAGEVVVTGGIGEFVTDEERLREWDHSFDNLYFMTFLSKEHGPLVWQFVGIIRDLDEKLYLWLMEGIMGTSLSEQEELCSRLRLGRLEDLGFPEPLEARSIYAPLSPTSFRLLDDKEFPRLEESRLPAPAEQASAATLLGRLLAAGTHPYVLDELNYLVNAALVAEGNPFGDRELTERIMERVHGMVTIALEHLSDGDESTALHLLQHERLVRLFRLGNSIVSQLSTGLDALDTSDYATERLVGGLRQLHPRYYRGLDADGIDGYREFRDLGDVDTIRALLRFHA